MKSIAGSRDISEIAIKVARAGVEYGYLGGGHRRNCDSPAGWFEPAHLRGFAATVGNLRVMGGVSAVSLADGLRLDLERRVACQP